MNFENTGILQYHRHRLPPDILGIPLVPFIPCNSQNTEHIYRVISSTTVYDFQNNAGT